MKGFIHPMWRQSAQVIQEKGLAHALFLAQIYVPRMKKLSISHRMWEEEESLSYINKFQKGKSFTKKQ